MWDTLEIQTVHLSHDLPCANCGHASHRYLACSDACDCVPAPIPGLAIAGVWRPILVADL